ncbi:hypothetical protein SeMB42_g02518 [Synchytrium endobioticum]|uniref:Uncharacterized protein n=1 Tax=Synchytrium endobioticum TaxID=286115 RepID=A0A507DDF3_9FUNG|nr:hypothetical protein SeMB42_g02518 [Synchytrium endobioticum]
MWGVLRLNAATRLAVGWLTKVTVPNLKSVFHGNWQLAFVNLDVSNDEEDEQGGGTSVQHEGQIHKGTQNRKVHHSMQEFEECSRRSLLDLCLIGRGKTRANDQCASEVRKLGFVYLHIILISDSYPFSTRHGIK